MLSKVSIEFCIDLRLYRFEVVLYCFISYVTMNGTNVFYRYQTCILLFLTIKIILNRKKKNPFTVTFNVFTVNVNLFIHFFLIKASIHKKNLISHLIVKCTRSYILSPYPSPSPSSFILSLQAFAILGNKLFKVASR